MKIIRYLLVFISVIIMMWRGYKSYMSKAENEVGKLRKEVKELKNLISDLQLKKPVSSVVTGSKEKQQIYKHEPDEKPLFPRIIPCVTGSFSDRQGNQKIIIDGIDYEKGSICPFGVIMGVTGSRSALCKSRDGETLLLYPVSTLQSNLVSTASLEFGS